MNYILALCKFLEVFTRCYVYWRICQFCVIDSEISLSQFTNFGYSAKKDLLFLYLTSKTSVEYKAYRNKAVLISRFVYEETQPNLRTLSIFQFVIAIHLYIVSYEKLIKTWHSKSTFNYTALIDFLN